MFMRHVHVVSGGSVQLFCVLKCWQAPCDWHQKSETCWHQETRSCPVVVEGVVVVAGNIGGMERTRLIG